MQTGSSASFGDLLKRFRLAAGLSQEELAERAGLSPRGVSDLERGARTNPRTGTIRLLADALQLAETDRAAFLAAAQGHASPDSVPRADPEAPPSGEAPSRLRRRTHRRRRSARRRFCSPTLKARPASCSSWAVPATPTC